MTYKIIDNKQINRTLWDACILQSEFTDVYALSWYLDIESPLWKGIVFDNYEAVFPLPIEPKYLVFKAIRTNFLTKDFRVYTKGPYNTLVADQVINQAIQSFFFVILNINASVVIDTKLKTTLKQKQYIDFHDHATYPSKNLRKSIRDAESQGYILVHDIPAEEAITFLTQELSHKHSLKEGFFFRNLKSLILESTRKGFGYVSGLYKDGQLCAVDFYAKTGNKLFLIQNAGNLHSKMGGMPFLLYQVIERFRSEIRYVDFMGSNMPNIISFNKNFCNKESHYHLVLKP